MYLADVVEEYPTILGTTQLTTAMEISFATIVAVRKNMLDSNRPTKLVQRIFTLNRLDGAVNIRERCDGKDIDILTAAALCFPVEGASMVRYDEPVTRAVVNGVAQEKGWSVPDILSDLFFADLGSSSSITGKSNKMEKLFALEMAQKDGVTVASILEPFLHDHHDCLILCCSSATLI